MTLMRLYTYKTTENGLTLEVFNPSAESICFMRGDDSTYTIQDIEQIIKHYKSNNRTAAEINLAISDYLKQYDS